MNLDNPSEKEFELAVYNVKRLFDSSVQPKSCPAETVAKFKERVIGIMEEIFNPEVPFKGAEPGSDACTYCPAKVICGR